MPLHLQSKEILVKTDQRILVATDFPAPAGALVDDIERYHTDEPASTRPEKGTYLAHADDGAAFGMGRVIRRGNQATVVLDELHRNPRDLPVLGRRDRSVLDEQLLGSITLTLQHRASCNVLQIP